MKHYKATYSANSDSTYLREPIIDTNKERITRQIIRMASGNRFMNNEASWLVYLDNDNDDDYTEINSGWIDDSGNHWLYRNGRPLR